MSSSNEAIYITPMAHLAEAKGAQDDWAGISDYATRKKMQNRLNQRAYRRRKAAAAVSQGWMPGRDSSQDRGHDHDRAELQRHVQMPQTHTPAQHHNDHHQRTAPRTRTDSSFTSLIPSLSTGGPIATFPPALYYTTSPTSSAPFFSTSLSTSSISTDPAHPPIHVAKKTITFSYSHLYPSYTHQHFPVPLLTLSADHILLPLIKYNLYRAVALCSSLLGIDPRTLHDDDALSPFNSHLQSGFGPAPLPLSRSRSRATARLYPRSERREAGGGTKRVPATTRDWDDEDEDEEEAEEPESEAHEDDVDVEQQEDEDSDEKEEEMEEWRHIPPSLRPTPLQRQIPHHPHIDLFPFPSLRDNLLLLLSASSSSSSSSSSTSSSTLPPLDIGAGFEFDEDEFCADLAGDGLLPSSSRAGVDAGGGGNRHTGLLVWGDPWNPQNWEVAEEVWGKWGWLIAGSDNSDTKGNGDGTALLRSTNFWRRKRGERELVVRF